MIKEIVCERGTYSYTRGISQVCGGAKEPYNDY